MKVTFRMMQKACNLKFAGTILFGLFIFICCIIYLAPPVQKDMKTNLEPQILTYRIEDAAADSCIARCIDKLQTVLFSAELETDSLCSSSVHELGVHQKVVSFSFYGKMNTGYYNGIADNLELMQVSKRKLPFYFW